MPIRPEYRWFYPIDWHELSALVRFQRAKGRCEQCGRPHGRFVRRLDNGNWYDEERDCWRDDRGRRARRLLLSERQPAQFTLAGMADSGTPIVTRIVLATAHLDHDPSNNDQRNLAALCQRCHLAHDRPEHRRRRWTTLFRRCAIGDLFSGRYP